MFVTMSAVRPMSSCAAAASFSASGMAPMISCAFMPAIAMKFIASAACDALNCVVAPSSRARSRSCSNSSPVAPDTAATWFIAISKSAPALMAPTPRPTIGAVMAVLRVRPAPPNAWAVAFSLLSACERALSNSVASMPSVTNCLKTSPSPTACPPFSGFDVRWAVQAPELAAHAVDGGAALPLAHRGGRRRAVLGADALGVGSEGLVLLPGALQVRLPGGVVRAFLRDDAEHLHEARVGDLGEDPLVAPAGQLVPADQVDAARERVCISGSRFISSPARAKKARRS